MKALGMNYPLQSGQQGYFEQTFDSLTNEKVKLNNLMNTIEGERYMQPNFGIGIQKYLFEPLTNDTSVKIETEIRKKVAFWLPDIVINNLYIDMRSDVDRNIADIEIDFSLKKDPNNYDVVTFTFSATR